jgi:hypothetical protein
MSALGTDSVAKVWGRVRQTPTAEWRFAARAFFRIRIPNQLCREIEFSTMSPNCAVGEFLNTIGTQSGHPNPGSPKNKPGITEPQLALLCHAFDARRLPGAFARRQD